MKTLAQDQLTDFWLDALDNGHAPASLLRVNGVHPEKYRLAMNGFCKLSAVEADRVVDLSRRLHLGTFQERKPKWTKKIRSMTVPEQEKTELFFECVERAQKFFMTPVTLSNLLRLHKSSLSNWMAKRRVPEVHLPKINQLKSFLDHIENFNWKN